MDFDDLASFLTRHGYAVKVERHHKYDGQGHRLHGKDATYRFALVTGQNIYGGLCEPNAGNSYAELDGKIAADNDKCFNKWRQCPLRLSFPADEKQALSLVTLLMRLGSDAGYEESNSFVYINNNPYHY